MTLFEKFAVLLMVAVLIIDNFALDACIKEIKKLKRSIKELDNTIEENEVRNAYEQSQVWTQIRGCEDDYKKSIDKYTQKVIKLRNDISRLKIEYRKATDQSIFDKKEETENERAVGTAENSGD